MNELAKTLKENEEGRWITTKYGAKVFILSRADKNAYGYVSKQRAEKISKHIVAHVDKKIPPSHLKNLKILYDDEPSSSQEGDADITGEYSRNKITMFKGYKDSDITHEIGHHVFHTVLDKSARKEFTEMHTKNIDGSPTKYGKTNLHEDFAESYMKSISGRLKDTGRKRFMDKYVFK